MSKILTPDDNDVKTYRRLRKAIGIMGIGLPIALITLSALPVFQTSLQGSISHYYYTNFRELFTGVLCAVGLFLIRYNGHENESFWKNDHILTNIAGYMAFGVVIFPTNPDDCLQKIDTLIPYCHDVIGYIHYGFAMIFFVILAIISINVFTIGQVENKDIPISILNENYIYKLCGYLIFLFIALIPVCSYIFGFRHSTLILEALALFAFGASWLVKGRALGDKGKIGRMVYREANA